MVRVSIKYAIGKRKKLEFPFVWAHFSHGFWFGSFRFNFFFIIILDQEQRCIFVILSVTLTKVFAAMLEYNSNLAGHPKKLKAWGVSTPLVMQSSPWPGIKHELGVICDLNQRPLSENHTPKQQLVFFRSSFCYLCYSPLIVLI